MVISKKNIFLKKISKDRMSNVYPYTKLHMRENSEFASTWKVRGSLTVPDF